MSIDTSSFQYLDSRWQDLYSFLKEKGYEVYSPGQKEGECLSPYVVVKYAGSTKAAQISSRTDLYELILYVPKYRYSEVETRVQDLINDMKELRPLFIPYDNQQDTSFFDADVKAHFVSLTYINYKKN